MGLKEEKHFKNHIALKPISEQREAFVAGTLFALGDSVVIKETQEVCNVVVLGSNYVIVERADGMRFRKWLDAVEVVESKSGVQPDWGTPESTKKAKEMTPAQEGSKPGLWDNIHARRKKGLPPKKPGQEGYPKTLNIEQTEMDKARDIITRDKQQASDMIASEKDKDKQKHDRILDQARRAMAMRKNKGTKV